MRDTKMVWIVTSCVRSMGETRFSRPYVAYPTRQAAQDAILADLARQGLTPTRWYVGGARRQARSMLVEMCGYVVEWSAWALPVMDVAEDPEQGHPDA